jgi:hypothetical protein
VIACDDGTLVIHLDDARDLLVALPAGSIDCCITSPRCRRLGRRAVAIELSPDYVDQIRERCKVRSTAESRAWAT